MDDKSKLRKEIFKKIKEYYEIAHKPKKFIPGRSKVHYAGRIYDEKEMISLVDSALDFWLTEGRYAKKFANKFSKYLGVKHTILTNSGSSANLLAISALTSPKLGNRMLKTGDEVVTVAASFATTINPIIQNGLVPVFLDVGLGTYNIDCSKIELALSEKTKEIFIAHTLGNPFALDTVMKIANKYSLFLIEDVCDALGSTYNNRMVDTFGDMATYSFYPAHHITIGESGAVTTNKDEIAKIIKSFRDWGGDCWCKPGKDNTFGKRFGWQLGDLPFGYDHKYIYSYIGYNLKPVDMQPAIGFEQFKKLPTFIEARKRNFKSLYNGLKKYRD